MSFGTLVEGFAHNVGFKDAKKGRAIIIGGFSLLVVGVVAFSIYKWRKRVNAEKYGADDANAELDKVKVNGAKTTITNGDAILISQNLLNAMDRMGTDSAGVLDNLYKTKNGDDLKLVIKTFGTKIYTGTGLATNWGSRFMGTAKNLNGWLRAELSGSDLKQAEDLFKSYGVPF
jgi:hypothetical protein